MATVTDFAELLFKKSLGQPSTLNTTEAFSEPNRPALAAVLQDQIYAERIPAVAPTDLVSATTDELGASIVGSYAGKKSTASPMIKRYVKVPLTVIPGTQEHAYEAVLDATYGRVTQDAVPYNFDPLGSYLFTLYRNDGTTVIPFGQCGWNLDCTSGVLTFYAYDAAALGVSAAAPPKISFYRYVGSKGAATASQTQQQITDSELTFTKPEHFAGGSTTLQDDTLAAVIVDDRDLATLSSSTLAFALQFGGNYDQSWRLVIAGAAGEPQGSSFQIQTRQAGAWVTKSSFWAT